MGRSAEAPRRTRQGHRKGAVRRRYPPPRACSTRGSCARPLMARRSRRVDTARGGDAARASRSSTRTGLVAALHADPEAAEAALWRTITARVDACRRPETDSESIFDHLLGQAQAPEVKENRGDPAAARARSAKRFETTYPEGLRGPCSDGAPRRDGRGEGRKVTVWASTQTPFPTRDRLAEILGFDTKSVRVITPYVGGGFGGKSAGLQADEAARLAKITGKPVQVAWSARRGVLLRHVRSRLRRQDQIVHRCRREDHAVGLRRLLRRRPRRRVLLRRPRTCGCGCSEAGAGRAERPSLRGRPLARPRREHERLRPRVADRPDGRRGRDRSPRVPPAQHPGRADAADPAGGRRQVRLEGRPRARAAGRGASPAGSMPAPMPPWSPK